MKTKTIFTALLLLFAVGRAQAQTPSDNWSDYRDTNWGGDITSTLFTIESYAQLAQFAYLVNNGRDFSGKTVMLRPQGEFTYYTMDSHYWIPIGTASKPFKGTFDGNGISVNYLKINSSEATCQGFFGYIGAGGIVKNTTVRYSTITAASQVGAIAGYNGGTMTNCVVIGSTISSSSYVGTIVGQNAGTMTTCYAITSGSTKAVGVEGSAIGEDVANHAEHLWTITGTNIQASVGTPTGTTLNNIEFYNDGIHFNNTHYYKSGTQTTVNYAQPGYTAIFSVSGDGASISGNVVTVGTSDVVVSAETVVAAWSGTGECGNPYLISNSDQFALLANRVNGGTNYSGTYFKLADDISTSTMVGTSANKFSGTFDGDGHTLTVTLNSDADHCAPFAYTDGATIQNLVTAGTIATSARYAGGVVGNGSANLIMTNVKSNVAITSNFNGEAYHGGLVGYAVNATLTGCAFTGSLLGENSTKCGGLVGYKTNEPIFTDCVFAPAAVTVSATDSYTLVVSDGIAEINNCYYTTALGTSQGKQVYRIVPAQGITLQLLDLETIYNVSGIATNSSSSKGLKFGDAFYAASGDQLDFELGVVVPGYTASKYYASYNAESHELTQFGEYYNRYPLTMPAASVTITAIFVAAEWDGDGSEQSPYLIYNKEQLTMLSNRVNGDNSSEYNEKYYKLMGNLTYDDNQDNYTAIGSDTDHKFNGHFDGDGHTIRDIKSKSVNYNGLFGCLGSDAEVKNIVLTNSTIGDGNRSGGIAGLNEGSVTNCHVTSSVIIKGTTQASYYHGGIVGNNMGSVSHCTFAGTLTKTFEELTGGYNIYYYGGIAGNNDTNATMSYNLVIGATIPTTKDGYGAIAGQNSGTLAHNYYTACTVGNTVNATNVGVSSYHDDITENDGAVSALRNNADNSDAIALMEAADAKIGSFKVQLTGRTFYKDGSWNTICLPFTVSDIENNSILGGDGVELWQFNDCSFDADEGELTLEFTNCKEEDSTTDIIAGRPYLIRWTNASDPNETINEPVFTEVTITATTPEDDNTFGNNNEITFIGTFNGNTFQTENRSILFLGAENTLYYPEAGAIIGAFRAYFQLNGITAGNPADLESPIKSFVLNFGDDTETGIFDVRSKTEEGRGDGVIYNITGQLLNKPQRGINIINGKKVVIK